MPPVRNPGAIHLSFQVVGCLVLFLPSQKVCFPPQEAPPPWVIAEVLSPGVRMIGCTHASAIRLGAPQKQDGDLTYFVLSRLSQLGSQYACD